MPNVTLPAVSIGWVIALLILCVVVVLYFVGRLDGLEALLFGGLALARLT